MRAKGVFHDIVDFLGYPIRFQRSYKDGKALYYCVYRRRKGVTSCPASAQYNPETSSFVQKIPHNHMPNEGDLLEELERAEKKKISAAQKQLAEGFSAESLMELCSQAMRIPGPSASPAQISPVPAPRKSSTFSTFVNQGIVDTNREHSTVDRFQETQISPEMEASLQSILSVVSSAESMSPQDPTGSRQIPVEEPIFNQILPNLQQQENFLNLNQAIQIEGKKEPLLTASTSGNRILSKLQQENESLSEQVEVLEKMNDRLGKKVKDLENKVKSFEGTEGEHAEKEKELVNLRKEDEIKSKTLADLLVKMEELEKELIRKNSSLTESEEKLKETTKKLTVEQKRSEVLEAEVRNHLTDQPNAEKLEILKSYLHPEMEKYAVEAVKEAIGTRELRGDAATAFVSKYFDELYGTHWQAVLFRSDGHGCLVQHNNNCFIRFRLGNYEFLLFRY